MTQTPKLGLPYIVTSQAQKEVTHNESLNALDLFVSRVAIDFADTPPGSPAEGDIYIVGTSPTGDFVGHDNELAQYLTGGWVFYSAYKWLDLVVEAEDTRYTWDGAAWVPFGLLMKDTGEYLRIGHWQEDITVSGADIDTTENLPDRTNVIAVNVRVTTAITGATSFDVGVAGETGRYGTGIGVALDSTNIGMTFHPTTYYTDTPVKLTSQGGNFTGGVVRVTAQYFQPKGPWDF